MLIRRNYRILRKMRTWPIQESIFFYNFIPRKRKFLEDNPQQINLTFPAWCYSDSGSKKNEEIEFD